MKVIIITALAVMLSGCSTLINGTDHVVIIDNYYNEKERIKLNTPYSSHVDTMPAMLYISGGVQSGGYSIRLESECYNQQSLSINKTLRGSYWLNLFNVVGFFVDYATGAMWEYPAKVHMPMSKNETCASDIATQ